MPFTKTADFAALYIAFVSLINLWSIPYDFITAHKPSCHTARHVKMEDSHQSYGRQTAITNNDVRVIKLP